MYKLTIIIPHYNSINSLVRLLKSIPQRDWIETIVIDDHSTVNMNYVKKEFINAKFLNIPDGKRWAGSARNYGLKNSNGKFILFADADDYFVDGAFAIIEKYINSNYDLIFFKPTSFNEMTQQIGIRHLKYEDLVVDYIYDSKKDDILYQFYVPWSKVVSKNIIDENKILFDEVQASNDINFSLKIGLKSKKIFVTEEVIYCVTESKGSLTKTKSKEVLDSRFYAISRYNDLLQENNLSNKQIPMILHLLHAKRFGIYNILYKFFYSKYKRYPIFYTLKDMLKKLKRGKK